MKLGFQKCSNRWEKRKVFTHLNLSLPRIGILISVDYESNFLHCVWQMSQFKGYSVFHTMIKVPGSRLRRNVSLDEIEREGVLWTTVSLGDAHPTETFSVRVSRPWRLHKPDTLTRFLFEWKKKTPKNRYEGYFFCLIGLSAGMKIATIVSNL